jgi:hypothetical protein
MPRPPERGGNEISWEMIHLFKRGCELQAAGHADVDDDSPEHDELWAIDKKLFALCQIPWHCCSLLDPALDGEMPEYMVHLAAGRDWGLSKQWRTALLQALDARRK